MHLLIYICKRFTDFKVRNGHYHVTFVDHIHVTIIIEYMIAIGNRYCRCQIVSIVYKDSVNNTLMICEP